MLERLRLELRILDRLADELRPLVDEPLEPAGVGLLGGGLGLKPASCLGREQFLHWQFPQFLVGGQEPHLAVADFARLLAELLQPLVEDQRVLGTIDDVQHQRRGVDAAAAWQVILRVGPDRDLLRLHAERVGAERGRRVDRFDFAATGLQDSFPLLVNTTRVGRASVAKTLPFKAHPPDAEVVTGGDLERERVGVEEHAP